MDEDRVGDGRRANLGCEGEAGRESYVLDEEC